MTATLTGPVVDEVAFPEQCPRHQDKHNTTPCGPCGDARVSARTSTDPAPAFAPADVPRTGHVCPMHHHERVRPFGRGASCRACIADAHKRRTARERQARIARVQRQTSAARNQDGS